MSRSVMQLKNKDIKDEVMALHETLRNAEECISLLQNAVIYNASKLVDECNRKVQALRKGLALLTEELEASAGRKPDLMPYCLITEYLVNIGRSIEALSDIIDKKIRENILFSDKALRETTFLLQRLIEILKPTADILLARNTFLAMYVQESQAEVGNMALEFATLHEERLIKGVCIPSASSLYISMLGIIKNIAWQSKEVAVKLAGP